MTSFDRAGTLMVSGRPMSLPLHDVKGLARRMVDHFARNLSPCGALPSDAVSGDVSALTRYCLEYAIALLDGGDTGARVARIERAAAAWAREGVPIDAVHRAVHAGFRIGLEMVTAQGPAPGGSAAAEDFGNLVEAIRLIVGMLDTVSTAVSMAYIRQLRLVAAEHHTAAHTLTSALLGGHATPTMAREGGAALAERYAVLALHIPPHPSREVPGADAGVVARRVLRRIQAALAGYPPPRPLALLSVDGGTLLVPAGPDHVPGTPLEPLIADLAEAAGVPVTATVVPAERAAVPDAARQAHQLLDTVLMIGHLGGLHRFDELALHFQLTRPGPARDRLAALLDPLDEYPILFETLRAYLTVGLDRRGLAARLDVHPNTVDHRIKRVARLTGHDPATAGGSWLLNSALIARPARGFSASGG